MIDMIAFVYCRCAQNWPRIHHGLSYIWDEKVLPGASAQAQSYSYVTAARYVIHERSRTVWTPSREAWNCKRTRNIGWRTECGSRETWRWKQATYYTRNVVSRAWRLGGISVMQDAASINDERWRSRSSSSQQPGGIN